MIMPVINSQNNSVNRKNPSFSADVYKQVGTKVLDSEHVKQGIYSFSLLAEKLDHRIRFIVNGNDTLEFRNQANAEEGHLACKLSQTNDSVGVLKTLVEAAARKFPEIMDFAPKFIDSSAKYTSKGWHRPHIKNDVLESAKHVSEV